MPDREMERRFRRAYREHVPVAPLDGRRLAERLATVAPPRRAPRWLSLSWGAEGLLVSPLAGVAAAAILLLAGGWTGSWLASRPQAADSPSAAHRGPSHVVEFVLVAPLAEQVTVAGDFNGWDPAAIPMRRAASGTWTTAIAIPEGRYTYSFVVDGRTWLPDPRAPLAPDDGFGRQNSVLLVQAGRSS